MDSSVGTALRILSGDGLKGQVAEGQAGRVPHEGRAPHTPPSPPRQQAAASQSIWRLTRGVCGLGRAAYIRKELNCPFGSRARRPPALEDVVSLWEDRWVGGGAGR